MAHKRRRQRNTFEDCQHVGFGTFCHRCKDEKAGRIKPKKIVKNETGDEVSATAAPKKYWNRAKCPFCNGSRVKKNEMNAFSDLDTKEFRCTSYECGKEFNSEQVKEYEKIEVQERTGPREYNPRLTD